MTWGRAQRRAEEFDALVDGTSATRELPAARDADLLELVGALRSFPPVAARPEFVSDLRGQLMAAAETALVPDDLSRLRLPERRTGRERRLAAVVGGLAVVGATTSVAMASQSALPGDSLYPIKRVIEQAHAGLAMSESSKGETVLASASDRLDEVDALAQRDGLADDTRIADTLDAFTDQATQASDLLLADYASTGHASSIAQLRDFSATSLDRLAALEPIVPANARDELIRAAGVLNTIDSEAAQRCPSCGGQGITSIPPVLASALETHETIVVPRQPLGIRPAATGGHHRQHHARGGQQPHLPSIDPGQVGPASVTQGQGGSGGSTSTGGGGSDPVGTLTHGLTGGLTGGGKSGGKHHSQPLPGVDDVVKDVQDLVGGVVDPVTGAASDVPKLP